MSKTKGLVSGIGLTVEVPVDELRALAASALSQDEKRGQS